MAQQYSARRVASLAVAVCLGVSCHGLRQPRASSGRTTWSAETGQASVRFDLEWPESFRTATGHHALWLFAKYRVNGGPWWPGRLVAVRDSGPDPLLIELSEDSLGAFLARRDIGRGLLVRRGLHLQWRPGGDAIPEAAGTRVETRLLALEMVYVPAGPFSLGDGDVADLAGHFRRSGQGGPFRIGPGDTIVLGQDSLSGLSNNNAFGMRIPTPFPDRPTSIPDDFNDASRVSLPPAFPTGVSAFYVMEHELTQEMYATFLNLLTPTQRAARNPAPPARPMLHGYSISMVPPFVAFQPDEPVAYISWPDAAAFADWAGLRPLTELEYEKAARGSGEPIPGAFAWGSTLIARQRYSLSERDTPDEQIRNWAVGVGNAAYEGTMGHPGPSCASCLSRALPVTAFDAIGTRADRGVSPVGVSALSGNLFERVVTVGHPAGRRFDGMPGDGILAANGDANGPAVASWPGAIRDTGGYHVATAVGTGLRGGSFVSSVLRLRISDRALAATPIEGRFPTIGIRMARTAPPVR